MKLIGAKKEMRGGLPILRALSRLHDFSARTAQKDGYNKLFQASIDAAVELTGADLGTLQLIDGPADSMRMVAQRGVEPELLEHLTKMTAKTVSTCTEVLRRGERVIVEDVSSSPLFAHTPELAVLHKAGVRAVQSTPILGRDGRLLAMFSTHWKEAHRPDEGTLRLLDVLARQLSDLLEIKIGSSPAPGKPQEKKS